MKQMFNHTEKSPQGQGADNLSLCNALYALKKNYGVKLYLQQTAKGWEACAVGKQGEAFMLLPGAPSLTSLTHLCQLVAVDNTYSPETGDAA